MKFTYLAYDGNSLINYKYLIYEISFMHGLLRLMQPWKYHLHRTMGRPIIVINKVWQAKTGDTDE